MSWFLVCLAGLLAGSGWAAAPEAPSPKPDSALAQAIAPILADSLVKNAQVGLSIVQVATGESVAAHRAEIPLVPASTVKLLTAAAALHTLGPAYRFTTRVYTDGERDEQGVLRGNLYVQGQGDPTLVVERLWKLMADLTTEGVRRIEGDVIFDASYMDSASLIKGWNKPEDLQKGPAYFAPLSALSVNHNSVSIVVGPGSKVGSNARVFSETPAKPYVVIDNQVTTQAPGYRASVTIERSVSARTTTFLVKGKVPAGSPIRRFYRAIASPTDHFIAVWRGLEKRHGIKVTGTHLLGSTPDTAQLVVQSRSRALAVALMDMNKYSSNFMAEQVLKTLGAEATGEPGTTLAGLQVVADYLHSLQIPAEERVLVNGSGLTRNSRLSPRALTTVLVDMAHNFQVGQEFAASLAIAGADGTLRRRLTEEPLKVRGKTGSLDGVRAIAGYLESADGQVYAFALVINGITGNPSRAKRLQDRLMRQLVQLNTPQSPTPPPNQVLSGELASP